MRGVADRTWKSGKGMRKASDGCVRAVPDGGVYIMRISDGKDTTTKKVLAK